MAAGKAVDDPTTVGKYRIESLLGEGGMGQVFKARHAFLGHEAAVKVLSPACAGDKELVGRFFNEARAAAALRHANIVEVYDVDVLPDGRPYMVMELLEGESLSALLEREGRLAPPAALAVLGPVCDAVGAAHARGIIHRDLKPDNIFISRRRGEVGRVKVLDFGIAKLTDDSAGGVSTRTGAIFGTPEYMSPEQGYGRTKQIGPPSDVYSTGVIAYRMLAGVLPFPAGDQSFVDFVVRVGSVAPASLRAHAPELPETVDRAVLKALAKNPAERFQTMEELAEALHVAVGARAGAPTRILGTDPPQSDARLFTTTLSGAAAETGSGSRSRRIGAGVVAGLAGLAIATVAVIALAVRGRHHVGAPVVAPPPQASPAHAAPALGPPKPLPALYSQDPLLHPPAPASAPVPTSLHATTPAPRPAPPSGRQGRASKHAMVAAPQPGRKPVRPPRAAPSGPTPVVVITPTAPRPAPSPPPPPKPTPKQTADPNDF